MLQARIYQVTGYPRSNVTASISELIDRDHVSRTMDLDMHCGTPVALTRLRNSYHKHIEHSLSVKAAGDTITRQLSPSTRAQTRDKSPSQIVRHRTLHQSRSVGNT